MNISTNTNAFFKMLPLSILMFFSSYLTAQVYPQSSLVKDLQVGSTGSTPRYFATLGNKTFFLANTETDISQPPRLMVTDGNDATVSSLISTAYIGISAPVIFNGQLYFGLQQTNSVTLWRSADGVSASLVDTVWRGSGNVGFYENYLYVKNNELYVKVRRDISFYTADYIVDLFKSSGQTNGLMNLGFAETKYYNAESTNSEIFRGINVDYFLTNFNASSNGYMGVRVSVGNNAPVVNYTWSAFQQPTAGITGLGVLNNYFIFINKDTLTRLNAQGQREVLLTGIQYGSKIAQVNNFIYFNSGKGIYRTDGTVTGTILISDSNPPISDTKPLLSDDISVIGDTLYLCGSNYSDKFGIWQINSASTVFKRILNIEAPKPLLKSIIINNKLFLTETIGNKTTLYEPDFGKNKVKIIGQLDKWDYIDTKNKNTYSVLNNNLICASGDDDATAVTSNAKGLELRQLSLTPSVLTYPCIADTVKPKWYSCPTDFVISQPEGFCIGTVLERPNAYDNCNVPITNVSSIRGSFIPEDLWNNGKPSYNLCPYDVYDTITYSAKDLAYNVAKCSFTAIARHPNPCNSDVVAPVFVNCPKDTVINSNQAIAVNWTSPAVSDNCGIPSLSVNYPIGTVFPIGVTNVIYTATDVKNNTSTCSFKITINTSTNPCDTDKIKPIFQSCPNNIVLTTTSTTAVATWSAPLATDNCGTPSLSAPNYASGTAFPIGTSIVYYTASDSKNNAASCTFEVTVSKVSTESDVCADLSANVKGGSNVINITGITTGSAIIQVFNSNWSSVFNQQVSANSFTVPNMAVGIYNVKVTVLGAGGKWPSVCSLIANNVTVTSNANPCDTDTQAPVFSNCPTNINLTTATNTAVANWSAPTATDNCTATPSVSSNYNSGFAFPIGTTNVVYSAKDVKNNTSMCSFNITVSQIPNNSCRYSDSLNLVDFYNSTGGVNWTNKWDLTKPIDTWFGVTLNANGCVKQLVLHYNNLNGNIPNLNLPNVEYISLPNNSLKGNIPNFNTPALSALELSNNYLSGNIPNLNCPNMGYFRISNNQLSGNIPNFNFPKIKDFSLAYNQLTGSIPNFNFPEIDRFNIQDNQLNGSIPNFNFPKITVLTLGNNQLSGSIPDFNFPIVYHLYLYNNNLSGCIPQSFNNFCIRYITVNLSNNPGLPNNGDWAEFCRTGSGTCGTCEIDTISPTFSNCPTNINLTTTTTTAVANWTAPTATDNCTATLSVSSNYTLGFAFPIGTTNVIYTAKDAKNNTSTCSFNVIVTQQVSAGDVCANPSANVKGGAGSITVSGITTSSAIIQIFNSAWSSVYNQQVTGSSVVIPISTIGAYNVKITVLGAGGKWPSLCSVLVNNVAVTAGNQCDNDVTAPTFNNCPQNISISTVDTSAIVVWTAPTATDNCTTTPSVSSNYNSGSNFPIGSKTVTYTAIDAKNNSATCSFIVMIDQKVSCRYRDSLALVDLYNSTNGSNWINKWDLTKPINTWYGIQLTSQGCVRMVYQRDGNLQGTIPNSFGNLSEVEMVDLSNNKLTGSIPNTITNLLKLKDFYLSNNLLSGSLPADIGLMKGLITFYAFNNQLSGELPSNIGNAPLKYFSVSNNKITGKIPKSISNFATMGTIELNNNLFDGCIPVELKKFCPGNEINIANNPNLPNNGDWLGFCNNDIGSCVINTFNDIALNITSNSATYTQWTTNTFRITAQNKGTQAMNSIKIKFQYPDKTVKGGEAIPSTGSWSEYCSGGVLCYEWTIPTIAANSAATLDIPLFILGATNPIVATTTLVTSTPNDVNTTNNTATVTVNPVATTPQNLKIINRQKPTQRIPIVIQTVAPNPTEGDVIIELESIVEKEVRFDFYNTLGKIVRSEFKQVKKGENQLQFDFWNATNGIYFIQTSEGEGRGVPLKFVKM